MSEPQHDEPCRKCGCLGPVLRWEYMLAEDGTMREWLAATCWKCGCQWRLPCKDAKEPTP